MLNNRAGRKAIDAKQKLECLGAPYGVEGGCRTRLQERKNDNGNTNGAKETTSVIELKYPLSIHDNNCSVQTNSINRTSYTDSYISIDGDNCYSKIIENDDDNKNILINFGNLKKLL